MMYKITLFNRNNNTSLSVNIEANSEEHAFHLLKGLGNLTIEKSDVKLHYSQEFINHMDAN